MQLIRADKSLLILISVFLIMILPACARGPFPQFPEEIRHQYAISVRDEQMPPALIASIVNVEAIPETKQIVRCLKFDIISTNPYKIKYTSAVELLECNGVGGFKTHESILFFNWIQDMYFWGEKNKKCFTL